MFLEEGIPGHSSLEILFTYVTQFSSVAQLCPTLCNPMDCSTPGLSLYHQLLESAKTHVYQVGDAIQPSQPLSSPSPPAFNLSQHQGLFQRADDPQTTEQLYQRNSCQEILSLLRQF